LTNVLRHGGPAARATVSVSYEPGRLVVQVDDDGSLGAGGAMALDYRDGTGTGIAGMRERAGAFGGTLEAGPRSGGGWRVRAVLPAPAVQAGPTVPVVAPA
jgi:signal transduction histidine kinase